MKLHTKKAFTLIELMIVIAIIAIIAAIAIPNLLSARKSGNEAAAIGALKALANAQTLYREGDKNTDNTLQYAGNLTDLTGTGASGNEDLIDTVFAGGTKQGYNFEIGFADQFVWYATSSPVQPGTTGDRYFGGNMSGLIFFNSTAAVTFNSDGSSGDPVLGN